MHLKVQSYAAVVHFTVKTNSCFRWSNTCFGYEGKTGKERDLVIFKAISKPINNCINEKALYKGLYCYIYSYGLLQSNQKNTLFPNFSFAPAKRGVKPPKQGQNKNSFF